ncbi:MAG: iron-sulfur cluster assembly protein [Chloroflexi bacterium]|nr:iron-sulfur cluster assembly protein [Chloroflexota bacterium]MDA1145119.1 iron-sulfur cluster assembly protein [Chloroflexota bacterium]
MADVETKKRPTTDEIWAVLKTVEDPELHMSITELGLIYDVAVDDEGMVTVDMTLTSPACPVGPLLQGMIYHKATDVEGVEDVEVNLVWSPPWDPREMASEEVKMALGIW